MGVDEFYNMLPIEFWNKVDGFYEFQMLKERNNWERTRWSTCLLLNIHLPKNKSIKPTDLIQFDWEKKKKKIDFEDLKRRAELYKKRIEHGK